MTRDEWQQYERVRGLPAVELAMRARCSEQGHQMENCCSAMFQVYERCKWCGERR